MEVLTDGRFTLLKFGPLGPFANNAYVIADRQAGECVIVDAPAGAEAVLEGVAGARVKAILMTHRHGDHWAAIDALKRATGAPVLCHPADAERYAGMVDGELADGQEIAVGAARIRVLHTPGHTPGSVCLLVDGHLISGDTLFPGGPGRSDSPEALRQEIASIVDKLLPLPDDTQVHPGHGDGTTIGAARREYQVFASREHPADLHGDVTWEGS